MEGPPPSAPVDLAVGSSHACALDDEGRVYCWGDNEFGQLGAGDYRDRPAPVHVSELPPITRIVAQRSRTCGMDESGNIWCWGASGSDRFCMPLRELDPCPWGRECWPRPLLVSAGDPSDLFSLGTNKVCRIVAGRFECCGAHIETPPDMSWAWAVQRFEMSTHFGCALLFDQSLRCWGSLAQKLTSTAGSGTVACYVDSPQRLGCTELPERVEGIDSPATVGVGGGARCAIVGEHVMCWGYAAYGQLGDGSYVDEVFPTPVHVIGF